MKKLIPAIAFLCAASAFAAPRSEDLSAEYLNSEQAMREDEYATSLARRDYLRNRLIVEAGVGSKMGAYGEPGMFKSYGFGVEYIFAIPIGRFALHPAPFFSYGFFRKSWRYAKSQSAEQCYSKRAKSYLFFPKHLTFFLPIIIP